MVQRPLILLASLLGKHRLQARETSVVAALRLSSCSLQALKFRPSGFGCFVAHGIFLDHRLNPCLLHWQVVSGKSNSQCFIVSNDLKVGLDPDRQFSLRVFQAVAVRQWQGCSLLRGFLSHIPSVDSGSWLGSLYFLTEWYLNSKNQHLKMTGCGSCICFYDSFRSLLVFLCLQ